MARHLQNFEIGFVKLVFLDIISNLAYSVSHYQFRLWFAIELKVKNYDCAKRLGYYDVGS